MLQQGRGTEDAGIGRPDGAAAAEGLGELASRMEAALDELD